MLTLHDAQFEKNKEQQLYTVWGESTNQSRYRRKAPLAHPEVRAVKISTQVHTLDHPFLCIGYVFSNVLLFIDAIERE